MRGKDKTRKEKNEERERVRERNWWDEVHPSLFTFQSIVEVHSSLFTFH
jgi:hypothetical protein